MAHGLPFKTTAQKDAICSENIKKALNINSSYDEDLKKGLSCLQKERKSLMQSLTKQKLDFLQRKKCKLPSIRRTPSDSENVLMQKKVAEFCCGVLSKNPLSPSSGSSVSQTRPFSQPSSNEKIGKFHRQRSLDRASSTMLDEADPLGQENDRSSSAIPVTLQDTDRNDFKTRPENTFVLPSPGVNIPPPRSPVSPRLYSSNTLDPNESIDLTRSRSQPCSPRTPRRRANTLDTPMNFLHNSCSNLKTALERSLSTPTARQGARPRAESSPVDFEVSWL